MNGTPRTGGEPREIIVVVDHEVLARHAIAEYLRECGYCVIEVGGTDQSLEALTRVDGRVGAVLCRADAIGALSASELARRLRAEQPEIPVMLAGNLEGAAETAGQLCSEVEIERPYDPAVVVDEIRRRLAAGRGR